MQIKTKIGILGLVFAFLANSVFAALPSDSSLGPSAYFTAIPTAVATLNPVAFDASASRDARGSNQISYRWDFEGKYEWTGWSSSSKSSYTFTEAGDYSSRLQVRDQDGLIDETALTVRVQIKRNTSAPFAKIFVSSPTGDTSTDFRFTVETFSNIHTPTHLLEVRWDWNHDGKWDTNFARAREFFHTFQSSGWQEVWLEVKDVDGSSSIEKGFYVTGKENDRQRTKEVGRILVEKSTAPRASFKTWPVEISPGTNVHFDASDSIRAAEYRWDFDGNGRFETSWSSFRKKTQRVFNVVGVFDAILEVRNSAGEIDRTQRTIAVADPNNILPEVKMRVYNRTNYSLGSRKAVLLDEIELNAESSRDVDGLTTRMEVRWDFEGDGIFDTTFATKKIAKHRYTSTGWHTPTLQVRDERGGLATTNADIQIVANTPPIAALSVKPAVGTRGTTFSFNASGSNDDQTGSRNLDYRFDFDGDGLFDTEFKSSYNQNRKFSKSGKFAAVVEVRDHANAASRATFDFEVADPTPPIAAFVVEPRVGTFNTSFQFNAGLTRDPSGVGGKLSYRWDFDYRGENDIDFDTGWSSGPKYNHRFKQVGDHRVRLIVKNSAGRESDFFTAVKVHEESASLDLLRKKGIITDESNPDRLISRAEFAKMIVRAAKLRVVRPRSQQFTDVKTNDWFSPYVAAVSARGWISPKANFAWAPNGSVNRAEAAKVVVSALYPRVASAGASNLRDISSSAWYARFAQVASEEDLLAVENGIFLPAQPITRAEAARMIAKLLDKYSLQLRYSNLLKANDLDFHTPSQPTSAREFLTSLLEKVRVY